MPTPTKGETQSEYVQRCVPIVMGEGKTQDEALGECFSAWRSHRKDMKMSRGSATTLNDGTMLLGGHATAPASEAPESDTAGLPKKIGGLPCFYSWKELIGVGNWATSKNEPVPVKRDRLDHWVREFSRMGAEGGADAPGTKVFIPDDHSRLAQANNGWIVKLKRVGDKILGLMQLIGDEARKKAACNDVSVGIAPVYVDGEQKMYRDVLLHAALTPEPVVNGLSPAVQAASRNAASDPANNQAVTLTRGDDMDSINCSKEHKDSIRKLVPGLDNVPDDELMSRIVQHHQTLAAVREKYAGGPSAIAHMSRAQIDAKADETVENWRKDAETLPTLRDQIATLSRQNQELGSKVIKPMDPDVEAMVLDTGARELSRAVEKGGISKIVADKLFDKFGKNAAGKVNTMMLSRAAINGEPNRTEIPLIVLAEILSENKAVDMSQRTGVQEMSRNVAGDTTSEEEKNAKAAHDMLNKHLGVPAAK